MIKKYLLAFLSIIAVSLVFCNFSIFSTPTIDTTDTPSIPLLTIEGSYTNTPTLPIIYSTDIPYVEISPTPSPEMDMLPTYSSLIDDSLLGTIQKNVTFCTADGINLKMDIYYPRSSIKPWPAVVLIHGGLWMSGDKSNDVTLKFVDSLVNSNYLVVAINYRLAPDNKFPDQLEDVKCAIRYLRGFHEKYNIDPSHIAVMGFSSGGHLAALAGVTDPSHGFDVGRYPTQSSKVQAVIDLSGPTNIRMYCDPATVKYVFGADNCDDKKVLDAANPATYISADDPPFLIIHGDQDSLVPLDFSQYLHTKLDESGVPNILLLVQNAGHSYSEQDVAFIPSFNEVINIVIQFLDSYIS